MHLKGYPKESFWDLSNIYVFLMSPGGEVGVGNHAIKTEMCF